MPSVTAYVTVTQQVKAVFVLQCFSFFLRVKVMYMYARVG